MVSVAISFNIQSNHGSILDSSGYHLHFLGEKMFCDYLLNDYMNEWILVCAV